MPGYDFAALAEEQEPYVITLSYKKDEQGRIVRDEAGEPVPDDTVVLPPVLPAKLMLQFFNKDREELKRLADSPAEQLQVGIQVIEELIGKETWDHVVGKVGFRDLNPLITDIMDHYSGSKPGEGEEEEEEGKAAPDNVSQLTTSSTTMEPSTPISRGSTPEPTNDSTTVPLGGPHSSPELHTFQPKVSS